MRTIKFRGQSILTDEWLYGDLVHSADKKRFAILVNDKDSYDECEVTPETVGQLTGLIDKNGTEIYEGDLLVCDEVPKILSEVYWNCSMSAFCFAVHTITEGIDYGTTPLGDVLNKFKSLHIVGNIHDNHELLKGGEK